MSQLYSADSMASLSNADCGSGCCANPTGICSGPGASTQNGKTGCGFGSGGSPSSAPSAPSVAVAAVAGTASAGGPAFDPAGAKNVGNGRGTQFIGGQVRKISHYFISQASTFTG
jgi:hypothetical protein